MISAVIFDVDGTLVDSVDAHARTWQQAFEHFGVKVDYREVRSQIGKGGDQLLPVFIDEDQVETLGKDIEDFRKKLYRSEYLPKVKGFPRVRELFLHLRERGLKYALASSAPEVELEQLKKIAKIDDLVELATSSDDAEKSKPHPDIFAAALEKLGGLNPADVVVVGDSPFDAIAAKKLSLTPIGVLCGGFPPDALREAGCRALFRDPEELLLRARASPEAWLHEDGPAPHA